MSGSGPASLIRRGDSLSRRGLIALSLSTLVFLPFWGRIFIYGTPFDATFQEGFHAGDFDRLDLIAGVLFVLLMAGLWLLWFLIGGRVKWAGFARLESLVASALLTMGIALTPWGPFFGWTAGGPYLPLWIPALILLAAVGCAIWRQSAFAGFLRGALVAATPIVVLTFGNAIYGAIVLTPPGASLFSHRDMAAPSGKSRTGERVVWIIFDELDQRIAFEVKRPALKLPAFERLSREGFHAVNGIPPFWHTYNSVSALLSGRPVRTVKIGPERMDLQFDGEPGFQPFIAPSNVFVRARTEGATMAAFGQIAFSYCTLLRDLLHRCWNLDGWWKGASDTVVGRLPKFVNEARRLVSRTVGGRSNEIDFRLRRIDRMRLLEKDLVATVLDPEIDFVFAHVALPHDPFIYDYRMDRFDPYVDQVTGYLGNLELADRMLGKILNALDRDGIGTRTSLIVSSDHWWRSSHKFDGIVEKRVPFLVRLKDARAGTIFRPPFPTLRTGDLLIALLRGEIDDIARIPSVMGNGP